MGILALPFRPLYSNIPLVPMVGKICTIGTNLITNGKEIGANGKNGNAIGTNGTNVTNQRYHWENPEHTHCFYHDVGICLIG